jgi:hypothetical protein
MACGPPSMTAIRPLLIRPGSLSLVLACLADGEHGPAGAWGRQGPGEGQLLAYATSVWLRVKRCRGPEQPGMNLDLVYTLVDGHAFRTWTLRPVC